MDCSYLTFVGDECKKSGKTFESPFVKHEPKDTKKEKEDNGKSCLAGTSYGIT